jgi:hypothetical protein
MSYNKCAFKKSAKYVQDPVLTLMLTLTRVENCLHVTHLMSLQKVFAKYLQDPV